MYDVLEFEFFGIVFKDDQKIIYLRNVIFNFLNIVVDISISEKEIVCLDYGFFKWSV